MSHSEKDGQYSEINVPFRLLGASLTGDAAIPEKLVSTNAFQRTVEPGTNWPIAD